MINYQHPVVQHDMASLLDADLPWEQLQDKTVLITGATGMLASYFAFTLLALNEQCSADITLLLLARSEDKLHYVYGPTTPANTQFLVQDVCTPIQYSGEVDYVLHAAGAAHPAAILENPVGVIEANTLGTRSVLEFVKHQAVLQRVLFTSTREIYGQVRDRSEISETDMGTLDPLDPRSCYPESKRQAEAMLRAYATQYDVAFNALRIAHSYGPGMQIENDGRVMSDFMNDAVNKRDIRINSTGEAVRAFCYITDAVEAMFRVMLRGKPNAAYNVANETDPVSIADLARLLQGVAGHGQGVTVAGQPVGGAGYTNYARVALDTGRLNEVGWWPRVGLQKGLRRTLESFSHVQIEL